MQGRDHSIYHKSEDVTGYNSRRGVMAGSAGFFHEEHWGEGKVDKATNSTHVEEVNHLEGSGPTHLASKRRQSDERILVENINRIQYNSALKNYSKFD
jgi:hypothetical protein